MAKGGKREGAGRKPKDEEKKIRDLLSPYIPQAIETVLFLMANAKREVDRLSASKLIIEYVYGKPEQKTDITSNGEKVNIPLINWADDNSKS